MFDRAREELAWLAFFVPRQTVQALSRRLPLEWLRDHLPAVIGRRLRTGLYPARIGDPLAVTCERRQPAWGDPAELDEARPIRFAAPPRASILMVTYGNLALTRLCLVSLQRAAGALPFEIIAVDNASSDGTPDYLRAVEAGGLLPLRAVLNDDNKGFAAANNQAAASARGDVLVFLNNDTVVVPDWLERLIAHLDRDRSIGLIGPVTNSCGNEAELGPRYSDLDAMARFAAGYTRANQGRVVEPAMLTLFCAAMPRALFTEVGGLDERYRIGMFEDDDLSEAVRARSRRVALAHDVFVHHYGGAAFSRLPPSTYLRIWWQNRRRFEHKWHRKWQPR